MEKEMDEILVLVDKRHENEAILATFLSTAEML